MKIGTDLDGVIFDYTQAKLELLRKWGLDLKPHWIVSERDKLLADLHTIRPFHLRRRKAGELFMR